MNIIVPVGNSSSTGSEKFTAGSGRRSLLFAAAAIAAAFGVLSMIPALLWGVPAGADLNSHLNFVQPFYDHIASGDWLPGWLFEPNDGFGDARVRFYPPGVYYLLSLFRFLTGSWYLAVLALFTFLSATGSFGSYLWARECLQIKTMAILAKTGWALAAAALFAFAPYRLTEFYQASLLAEFAAGSLLPFVFLFIARIVRFEQDRARRHQQQAQGRSQSFFNPDRILNVAGLGAAGALIVQTHLPTALLTAMAAPLFLGLLLLFSAVTLDRSRRSALLSAGSAAILALAASSWFWIKMVSELSWVAAGTTGARAMSGDVDHYQYTGNFVFSPFSATNLNVWYGSLLAALTVTGLLLPAILAARNHFSLMLDADPSAISVDDVADAAAAASSSSSSPAALDRGTAILRAALWTGAFSIFMTTDLSRPVWLLVPKLGSVQFPYRWLGIASAILPPVAAMGLSLWLDGRTDPSKKVGSILTAATAAAIAATTRSIRFLLIPAAAACFIFSFFYLAIDSDFLPEPLLENRARSVRGAWGFADWLPPGAADASHVRPMIPRSAEFSSLDREIISSSSAPAPLLTANDSTISSAGNSRRCRRVTVGPGSPASILRVRSFYYPLWEARDETTGELLPAESSRADGTLNIRLESGHARSIEIRLIEPARTRYSVALSICVWGLMLGAVFFPLLVRRRRRGLLKLDTRKKSAAAAAVYLKKAEISS